jgi:hypothetical protein
VNSLRERFSALEFNLNVIRESLLLSPYPPIIKPVLLQNISRSNKEAVAVAKYISRKEVFNAEFDSYFLCCSVPAIIAMLLATITRSEYVVFQRNCGLNRLSCAAWENSPSFVTVPGWEIEFIFPDR